MKYFDQLAEVNARHEMADASAAWVVGSVARGKLQGGFLDPEYLNEYLSTRKGLNRHIKELVVKAAVAPVSSTALPGAAFLSSAPVRSVFDKLGAVRLPLAGTPLGVQVGAPTAGWVGEAVAKPISTMSISAANLPILKLQSSIVVSNEILDFSAPGALQVLERAIASAVASALDDALLNPASAAIANVKPASLTAGVTPITGAGDVSNQVGQALGALPAGAANIVLVVSRQTALRLATIANFGIIGVRVLVSPAAANSIIAIDAEGVATKDGGVELARAEHATIQMDDVPDNPTTSVTSLVSLWQSNLSALRAERLVNWTKRAGAVAVVTVA